MERPDTTVGVLGDDDPVDTAACDDSPGGLAGLLADTGLVVIVSAILPDLVDREAMPSDKDDSSFTLDWRGFRGYLTEV